MNFEHSLWKWLLWHSAALLVAFLFAAPLYWVVVNSYGYYHWSLMLAAVVVMTIPVILVYLVIQRFIQGEASLSRLVKRSPDQASQQPSFP